MRNCFAAHEFEGSTSNSSHTYPVRNPVVGLTADRTGGNYGDAVTEADRKSNDPSNYVILVNDDYEQDSSGAQTDLAYNQSLVDTGGTIDVTDHDLAKITLHQVQFPGPVTGGTVSVTLSNSSSVNLYDASGHRLTWSDLTATLVGVDALPRRQVRS